MSSPLEKQIGGSHYTGMKIQPMEFSMANNLNACQHTAIKYICRYKDKGGEEDINKAIHVLELLKEMKYGADTPKAMTHTTQKVKITPLICPECQKPKVKVSEFMQEVGYPEYLCTEHFGGINV